MNLKPNDVHRSVRTQRFSRAAGDSPNIGRVARVPGTGLPKAPRKRRKRDEASDDANPQRKRRRTVVLAWSMALVLAAFSVLGFFLFTWLRGQMGLRAGAEDTAATIQRHNVSEFPSPSEQDALKWVKLAMAVRDPEQVGRYFRLGAAKPEEVVSFLKSMLEQDGEISEYQWLSSMDANHLLIDGVLVVTTKEEKTRNRLALLTPDESGVWKVDFEAFARTVRPELKKILAADGGQGVVRVILAKDSYFNGPFKDEDKWLCYGMASPDTDQILLGYCRKGSPQAHALAVIFQKEEDAENIYSRLKRTTLGLKRPKGAEERQFEITRVLAEDWVLSDKAFDETSVSAGSPDLPPAGGGK